VNAPYPLLFVIYRYGLSGAQCRAYAGTREVVEKLSASVHRHVTNATVTNVSAGGARACVSWQLNGAASSSLEETSQGKEQDSGMLHCRLHAGAQVTQMQQTNTHVAAQRRLIFLGIRPREGTGSGYVALETTHEISGHIYTHRDRHRQTVTDTRASSLEDAQGKEQDSGRLHCSCTRVIRSHTHNTQTHRHTHTHAPHTPTHARTRTHTHTTPLTCAPFIPAGQHRGSEVCRYVRRL